MSGISVKCTAFTDDVVQLEKTFSHDRTFWQTGETGDLLGSVEQHMKFSGHTGKGSYFIVTVPWDSCSEATTPPSPCTQRRSVLAEKLPFCGWANHFNLPSGHYPQSANSSTLLTKEEFFLLLKHITLYEH